MQGAIAEAFGAVLKYVWNPRFSVYAPREFKVQLQRFAPQFSGYQQHDSQELVAFLLDGLHEDLNRVLKKPYVEKPDWNGGGDKELVLLAKESWEGYKRRNDSVIVDLFQGQYRSTLVCPECNKVRTSSDCILSHSVADRPSQGFHNIRSVHVFNIAITDSEEVDTYDPLHTLGYFQTTCQGSRRGRQKCQLQRCAPIAWTLDEGRARQCL